MGFEEFEMGFMRELGRGFMGLGFDGVCAKSGS